MKIYYISEGGTVENYIADYSQENFSSSKMIERTEDFDLYFIDIALYLNLS